MKFSHSYTSYKSSPLFVDTRKFWFWIDFICFFLIATPFELSFGSGYVYAIKAISCIVIIIPRLAKGTVSIDSRIFIVLLLAAIFLSANIVHPSVRALLASFLILIGALVGMLSSAQWRDRLTNIVTAYIVLHLVAFGFSFIQFILLGKIVDIHGIIFSSASRVSAIGSTARLSGLHIEPGTYSQWMLMATFLRCLLVRRIVSLLTIITGLSLILTFSLWAVIGTGLLALSAILEIVLSSGLREKLKYIGYFLLLVAIIIVGMYFIPEEMLSDSLLYLDRKSELNSISGMDKLAALNELNWRLPDLWFIGLPVEPGFCPQCLSPQDVGLWANGIYYFGVIPALFIIIFISYQINKNWGFHFLPFVIAMLLWKDVFYDPFLWFIIGASLSFTVLRYRRYR